MGTAILLGVMVLVTITTLVTGFRMPKSTGSGQPPARKLTLAGGAILLVLTVIVFLINIMVTIDPRHVGVVTSFGKTTGVLDNGLHPVAPWSQVTQFDGTIQSMNLQGQGDDGAIVVRLKDGSTARVNTNLQWQINVAEEEGVKKLFQDYRDPVRVDEMYVERQLRAAVYEAFAVFDPTAGIADNSPAPSLASFATSAKGKLSTVIGGTKGISVVSLTISDVAYDDVTNAKLSRLRALVADKRAAELQVDINKKVAEANNELSTGAKDEGTLYQLCLATTEKLLEAGKALPAGWTCGGASAQTVVPVR